MLLPLAVLIESVKAFHLQGSNPADRLALARPQSHHFAPDFELFAHLCLLSKILSQRSHFALLQTQHSVASASLCVDCLRLLY